MVETELVIPLSARKSGVTISQEVIILTTTDASPSLLLEVSGRRGENGPNFSSSSPCCRKLRGSNLLRCLLFAATGRRKKIVGFVSRADLTIAAKGQRKEVGKSQEDLCVSLCI